MQTSRAETETGAAPSSAPASPADAVETVDAAEAPAAEPFELDDASRALLLATREQAELLALLTGSVRAGLEPLADPPPGAVDLIGALGPLESPDAPGSDPLAAFASVAPRFGNDAAQVVSELGAA